MYEKHPDFQEPEDENALIWRYMDFAQFVSLIDRKALHFARADKLDDPCEGLYSEANRREAKKRISERLDGDREHISDFLDHALKVNKYAKRRREFIYISCWHLNDYESEAMWKLYSGVHKGIAIQTTFTRFTQSFTVYTREPVRVSEVIYVDYNSYQIPTDNEFQPFRHKRKVLEYEHELRALISRWDEQKDKSRTQSVETGLYVSVDLEKLIDTIYVSPLSPQWFVELVKSVTGKYGIHKRVNYDALAASPPE